jgi:CheY-like chemotaxis protein
VVDDDALVAMSTVDMLEDLGHEAIEANSGERALEYCRTIGASTC